MADKNDRWEEGIPGRFYVDKSCISCDACVSAAPDNFAMSDDNGHAYVKAQPKTKQEEDFCKEALEGCPVEAIGNDGDPEAEVQA